METPAARNTSGDAANLFSESGYSLASIFANVNPQDGRFLKYLPDGFLNEDQKTAKAEALHKQADEYANYRATEDNTQSLSQEDSAYLSTVKSGDMETAQRMVDEEAKRAGYTQRAYHGTDADRFNVFDPVKIGEATGVGILGDGFYFADSKKAANKYGKTVYDVYLKAENTYHASEADLYKIKAVELEKQGYDSVDLQTGIGKIIMVFDPQ